MAKKPSETQRRHMRVELTLPIEVQNAALSPVLSRPPFRLFETYPPTLILTLSYSLYGIFVLRCEEHNKSLEGGTKNPDFINMKKIGVREIDITERPTRITMKYHDISYNEEQTK